MRYFCRPLLPRCPGGGIGRRARLKLAFRKVWVRFHPGTESLAACGAFLFGARPRRGACTLQDMTHLFLGRPGLAVASFALAMVGGHAQVTLGPADLPQGGTTYTFQNAFPDFGLNMESTGPGWVWDFSELVVQDSTDVEVQDISSASFSAQIVFNGFDSNTQADHFYTLLSAPDFGDAGGDFGIAIDELTGYFQMSGSSYTQVGVGLSFGGLELPVVFEDLDELHPLPLTADASLTSTAVYEIAVPATFTYAVNQVRTAEVDGYGTLLLPDGTSHEALRLKSTVVSEDSVYVNLAEQGFAFPRETVTYAWLGDGGMPWMEVVTNLGIPSLVRYQGSAPEPEDISGLLGLREGAVVGSPNPANRGQWIRMEGALNNSWAVHTLDGRQCMTLEGQGFRPKA